MAHGAWTQGTWTDWTHLIHLLLKLGLHLLQLLDVAGLPIRGVDRPQLLLHGCATVIHDRRL